jgi:hypothetical protein
MQTLELSAQQGFWLISTAHSNTTWCLRPASKHCLVEAPGSIGAFQSRLT